MREYLSKLNARKPVVYTGDLNVGHLDLDIHNPEAKHISKQAGLTPVEREAFAQMLSETQYVDAFRHFHPGIQQFSFPSFPLLISGSLVHYPSTVTLFICSELMFHFFVYHHTDAKNQFTYWSQRAFNRPGNKGIRLDYFICSPDLFPTTTAAVASASAGISTNAITDAETSGSAGSGSAIGEVATGSATDKKQLQVYDSYILHGDTVGCSDHCPVVLVLKL